MVRLYFNFLLIFNFIQNQDELFKLFLVFKKWEPMLLDFFNKIFIFLDFNHFNNIIY